MEEKEILNDGFDVDEYHANRVTEIEDPAERAQAKRLYESFFRPFYQYMEQRYAELENRMEQKFYGKEDDFCVVTGICERSRLALCDTYMFPMLSEDNTEKDKSFEEIKQQINTSGQAFCYSVFMQTDALTIRQLLMCKRRFRGIVYTEDGEFDAEFILRRSERYESRIEELKDIFSKNQIRWQPVSAPYINKMLDVYIVSLDYTQGERLNKITIDFEEFSPYVKYQYIPIWNIGRIKKVSGAYPVCQKDSVNYVHTVFKSQLQETSQYLVSNKSDKYWGICRQEGDLQICSDRSEPVEWELLELHEVKKSHVDSEYPYFANKTEEETGSRLNRTKGEVERFVAGLALKEYMELITIRTEEEKKLILAFENKITDHYLRYDILEYIMERVQWEWQEYECMGIFV